MRLEMRMKLTLWAVTVAVLALLAAPLTSEAQQPAKIPRIGVLSVFPLDSPFFQAFRRGLRELGYAEGQNLAVEWRYAQRDPDRVAAELVGLKVDLIVAAGTEAAQAAQRATRTIPVVFTLADEPIALGLVASLARPAGNLTGLTNLNVQLSAKRLELLKEAVPKLSRVAALGAQYPLSSLALREAHVAARTLGIKLQYLETEGPEDLNKLFAEMRKERAEGLLLLPAPQITNNQERIGELALKHRLPGISPQRGFAERGGLMAYGTKVPDLFHRAATFVDKMLKGAKPADLPVEQPTRFELLVNLKTAKALGLRIPPAIGERADQVIE
jgi:putative ABC transport system substrate-binding protein